jgi:hypothetical protein
MEVLQYLQLVELVVLDEVLLEPLQHKEKQGEPQLMVLAVAAAVLHMQW